MTCAVISLQRTVIQDQDPSLSSYIFKASRFMNSLLLLSSHDLWRLRLRNAVCWLTSSMFILSCISTSEVHLTQDGDLATCSLCGYALYEGIEGVHMLCFPDMCESELASCDARAASISCIQQIKSAGDAFTHFTALHESPNIYFYEHTILYTQGVQHMSTQHSRRSHLHPCVCVSVRSSFTKYISWVWQNAKRVTWILNEFVRFKPFWHLSCLSNRARTIRRRLSGKICFSRPWEGK